MGLQRKQSRPAQCRRGQSLQEPTDSASKCISLTPLVWVSSPRKSTESSHPRSRCSDSSSTEICAKQTIVCDNFSSTFATRVGSAKMDGREQPVEQLPNFHSKDDNLAKSLMFCSLFENHQ